MQPEEQIKKLHEAMQILNRGNATTKEVTELFSTLAKAIKQIREDLDKKITTTGQEGGKSYKELIKRISDLESRISVAIRETNNVSKSSLEGLKSDFNGKLQAIRDAIPTLPDFQAMLGELEAKIPQLPPEKDEIEYKAGRNIEIEGEVITNTNPKITVSRDKPTYPQLHDIWIRL